MDIKKFSIDRSKYDHADTIKPRYIAAPGLTEELVRKISTRKNEPDWMLQKRLQGLELFHQTPVPTWGPDLSKLNFDDLVYYVDPDAKESTTWEEVPEEIRKTFDRLGIPEAEKKSLAGVGSQYDSSVVYHKLREDLERKGVIFENMDTAIQKYPELVKKYFMTSCIPVNDHKFIMLHAAVWSGGTFIYIPPNTKIDLPLQAYFRMNAEGGGQFEHTLIIVDQNSELHYIEGCSSPRYNKFSLHAGCVELHVLEGARMRYSSIENWSRNTFNLNTKRALVHKNARVEWINGNMGSCRTMLYPSSILVGEGAQSDSLGIAFANNDQDQDTGAKVVHAAPHTSSTIRAKSISKGNGISSYRGSVYVTKNATNVKSSVTCDALLIDPESVSKTYPFMKVDTNKVDLVHEASVGKIGEEELFYVMARGLSEEQAMKMIVSGFVEPVIRELPLEYAVELNKLMELEMENFTA